MSLSIRRLGLADASMVEELLDTFTPGWADGLAPGASGAIAFIADSSSFIFGAYADHDPVGWLWGTHIRRPDGRTMTYVHQIAVIETHRRQGVASLLVESALVEARQRGAHKLWLMTRDSNDASNALYRSLGAESEVGGSRLYEWTL